MIYPLVIFRLFLPDFIFFIKKTTTVFFHEKKTRMGFFSEKNIMHQLRPRSNGLGFSMMPLDMVHAVAAYAKQSTIAVDLLMSTE